MILGIIIGYGLRRISFLRKVEVSISYTVFLLLFVLGVTIGSNRLIVDNLFSFGWQAALLALSATVGSILASKLMALSLYYFCLMNCYYCYLKRTVYCFAWYY